MNALLKLFRLLMFILAGLALALTITYFVRGADWQINAFDWGRGRHRIQGSDHLITQVRPLDVFDAIEIDSSGDFDVKIGASQSLSLEAPDNVIDLITTRIRDHTLVVDSQAPFITTRSPKFTIVVPQLSRVEVSGSASMHLHGLHGDRFALRCEGAGDFTADGSVGNLTVAIEGAGRVDTHQLQAQSVKVEVDGAGYARVYASQSLDARINGIGSIVYGGSPPQTEKHMDGIGSIKPDEFQTKDAT